MIIFYICFIISILLAMMGAGMDPDFYHEYYLVRLFNAMVRIYNSFISSLYDYSIL